MLRLLIAPVLEPRLDRDGRRNRVRDAALVLREVLPLLLCNCQDQAFRPVACDQKALMRHPTKAKSVSSPASAGCHDRI